MLVIAAHNPPPRGERLSYAQKEFAAGLQQDEPLPFEGVACPHRDQVTIVDAPFAKGAPPRRLNKELGGWIERLAAEGEGSWCASCLREI
jgi:hypothetical protein